MIYAGIDEAGYGPRIGPLTVGLSVFRVHASEGSAVCAVANQESPAALTPDLWRTLRGVIGKSSDLSRRRRPAILVDDSKRLKGANGLKRRHPLDHLEQSVFAILRTLDIAPATDEALFECLGASTDLAPWYLGEPSRTPITTTAEHVGVLANAVRAGFLRHGVEALCLRCELVGEAAFNEIVAAQGSKAVVNFSAAAAHLRYVWREYGHESPIVAIDRHGGRVCYGKYLSEAFPGAIVRALDETHDCSVYEIADSNAGRRMLVRFEIECDSKHLPTALASMVAKLVRELSMARLNRYWSARLPELKPTAGYGVDARRWLDEVEPHLKHTERAWLVRVV